ncbi:MAG: HAMP domain-containing sensor histidine kinase [Weeksellaceae bacterium]
MKLVSLKYYTLRYFSVIIPLVIALWAASFYWLIVDEVYDNIDDGLKDTELRIKDEIKKNPVLLKTNEFGLAKFRFTELNPGDYEHKRHIYNAQMYMEYDGDHEPIRMLQSIFEAGGKNYQLEIYASTIEEDEFAFNLFLSLLGLYFILVVSMVLLNHFVLKKVWKPFYSLMEQLDSYKLGEKSRIDTSPKRISEFAELEAGINEMIERNEKIYSGQKQFIENASHELQTPIAIMGNKLEMMLSDENPDEKQISRISELLQDLSRLKKLNKSLLRLSKIENTQYNETSIQNFNQMTHEIFVELKELYAEKRLKTGISEEGIFEIEMNPELSNILLSNLIRNAFIHCPSGGKIQIRITETQFEIYNSGDSALDGDRVFERFYSDSKSSKSSGLGLAMVKSIVLNCPNLSVGYRFDNGHFFWLKKN